MSRKDHVVAQLLQPSPSHPIISKRIVELDSQGNEKPQEVSTDALTSPPTTTNSQVDVNQPSILDMMIAAQREAKQQLPGSSNNSKSQSDSKQPLPGATGDSSAATKGLRFKKGFLSSSNSSSSSSKKLSSTGSTASTIIQSRDDDIIDLKKPAVQSKATGDAALVLEDVQRALAEDEHPMLKALKQNDWITPDLATKIRNSDVLSRGLSDPRCMAAIQLLQKNPQQAMQQFQHDPVVSLFLREFAGIMASHFESLGGTSTAVGRDPSSGEPAGQSRAPLVQEMPEIGPLHSKVLSDAESSKQRSKKSVGGGGGGSEVDREEERRVQKVRRKLILAINSLSALQQLLLYLVFLLHQILQDDELRSMLMDPALQQILLECGDPAHFQRHMRDPETARKIVRLQQAGLVGTAK